MSQSSLDVIFKPQSVAVIGASTREGSVGHVLFRNVLVNGYTGVVYPVNMKAKSVLGVKAYPSVRDIEDDIDLAILIVPALAVPAVLAECGQKKVKGAIVISAGFKEMGPTGAQLELAVRDRARSFGIRLIGPNCFGMINTDPATSLNTTFGRVMPRHGSIALISQSGAIGVNALEYAQAEEVGLSKFISIGNKADINECDLLEYLKEDEETDVIALYLEDLVDPPEFMRIARETTSHETRPKPILAIKAGRTTEGAKAASSHTGALAGSDAAYDAFFAQARILRVDTINELFAKAVALDYQPVPRGPRVAILTNAGGVGIMATDACVRNGLELARFAEKTKTEMRKHLPVTASVSNPVDVIGDADEKRYRAALELMIADENVDGLIPIWTPTLMAEAVDVAGVIAELGQKSDKPILACIQTMGDSADIRKALRNDRIPHYQFPENAARAMAAMAEYGAWSRKPQGEVTRFADVKPDVVRQILARARAGHGPELHPQITQITQMTNVTLSGSEGSRLESGSCRRDSSEDLRMTTSLPSAESADEKSGKHLRPPNYVSEPEGHEILAAYGLPVLPSRLCQTTEQAVKAADGLGYPVVIKVVSPQILHKTDVGGVKLGLADASALSREFGAMMANVKQAKPDADIWGILVQKMASKRGTETILGMKRDPSFGPLLMFGLGGILVEVLKDVTFRIAPLNDLSADSMVTGIKAAIILEGFRGEPARDVAKIKECLLRLSQLVTDFPDFDELDINPLLVFEQGKGALVLDARFLLK